MSSHSEPSEKFSCVEAAERERIDAQRQQRGVAKDEPYSALCLSGGGIRSASFGLGVIQALDRFGVLRYVDYLSSVSGGGYIGSSYTWLTHAQTAQDWTFPFGTSGLGARTAGVVSPLNFIRQHGNYLKPGQGLGTAALIGNFLRNSLLAFFIYFMLLTFVVLVLDRLQLFSSLPSAVNAAPWMNPILAAALIVVGLFALLVLAYSIGTYLFSAMSKRDYLLRVCAQRYSGRLLSLLAILLAFASLPLTERLLKEWLVHAGSTMSVLGGLASALEFRRRRSEAAAQTASNGSIWTVLASLLLIYGLLLLSFAFSRHAAQAWGWDVAAGMVFLLLPALVFGYLVDINHFGPGRLYRDRLMETFMPDLGQIAGLVWLPAVQADAAKLSAMCPASGLGPYHILNCNAILVGSKDARFRDRGGDCFILSPLYCGSDATGWVDTCKLNNNRMTLATAMSISGAALNPNAANNGVGATRSRSVSFLLSFFNLGLGHWVQNPRVTRWRRWLGHVLHANFLYPGLRQGLLGAGLNETAGFICLSDGGHFDNTGLYEMARRRLPRIIIAEAGADPQHALADLGNAVERIRVDFGHHIHFPPGQLEAVRPVATDAGDEPRATQGFAVGKIYYCDGSEGVLVYIQAVLIADLPADVEAYRRLHPQFPDQPTTDQFFDEAQLEAYRELGYQISKRMIKSNPLGLANLPSTPAFGLSALAEQRRAAEVRNERS
ncbi:patatin-like phospholipase family protein [Pseudomarimonas arenosa]|uniref:Patatin-like phospholipase family protein n=1 Tax=Pseudomarimonas arenosa TaxID=2774145 RepID=A0AAW3ZI53_9GAMM|nr:patatin-like phospholipase family protein [Pseudomarimonas arenosa]MBD8525095.1 patatin-like phospholipase family protein [Pseudomarimonas arenosa]